MFEFLEIMIVDDLPELYKWGEAEKEVAFLNPVFIRASWTEDGIVIKTPDGEKKLGNALSKVFAEAIETLQISNWEMSEEYGNRRLYENQYRKLTYKESGKEELIIENTERMLVAFDELMDVIDCFCGKDNYNSELMLHKAILLATKAHKGQVRKGTGLDYLCHPMEVLEILSSMGADLNLRIAGVLHDTVEDTDVEIDEIREMFGDDVGDLVAGHTEDKSKSWQERKSATIEMLKTADTREKMLVLADKVSNLRSIYHDLQTMGEKIWERFRFPRDKQSWYYSGVQDALYDLQFETGVEHVYWEMVRLHKDIFVDFLLAEEEGALYQKSADGEIYVYFKSTGHMGQWEETQEIYESAIEIPRVTAECIEDLWRSGPLRAFEQAYLKDVADKKFSVYAGRGRYVDMALYKGQLEMAVQDISSENNVMTGDGEYEFFYKLNIEETKSFLLAFRREFGFEDSIERMLKSQFGFDNAPERFTQYCDEHGIEYGFVSI